MDKINHFQFNNTQASNNRLTNTQVISKHIITNNNQLLPCCKDIRSRKAEIETNYYTGHSEKYYTRNNNEDLNYILASTHGNTEYLKNKLEKTPENLTNLTNLASSCYYKTSVEYC